uniref:Uncharacterized protein n=1 Tax=Anguilla anguilla TaxID=7936 RepID=A0A0E9SF53_ANGAN
MLSNRGSERKCVQLAAAEKPLFVSFFFLQNWLRRRYGNGSLCRALHFGNRSPDCVKTFPRLSPYASQNKRKEIKK